MSSREASEGEGPLPHTYVGPSVPSSVCVAGVQKELQSPQRGFSSRLCPRPVMGKVARSWLSSFLCFEVGWIPVSSF